MTSQNLPDLASPQTWRQDGFDMATAGKIAALFHHLNGKINEDAQRYFDMLKNPNLTVDEYLAFIESIWPSTLDPLEAGEQAMPPLSSPLQHGIAVPVAANQKKRTHVRRTPMFRKQEISTRQSIGRSLVARAVSRLSRRTLARKTPRQRNRRIVGLEKKLEKLWIQHIQEKTNVGLKKDAAGSMGYGVFATKKFYKNEFVVEYEGEQLSCKEGDRRFEMYSESLGSYMYFFCNGKHRGWIDATQQKWFETFGRYINHDRFDYNLKTKLYVAESGKCHVFFVASRDIQNGEQLFYNYNDKSKLSTSAFPFLKGQRAKRCQ